MRPFLISIDSGLNECFEKLKQALDGLNEDELKWRPTLESNNINWIVWHMAVVEDSWINVQLRKSERIWDRDGWEEHIGSGGWSMGQGWGSTPEEIRAIPPFDVPLVMEYYEAVRKGTTEYFTNEMQEEELSNEITHPRYDPVTYAWVLGHLLCEEAEHLGQIEYMRGMMRGMNK